MQDLRKHRKQLALVILLAGIGYVSAAYFGRLLSERCRTRARRLYRPPLLYRRGQSKLDQWPDEKVRRLLGFSKEEIRTLVPLLGLEEVGYPWRVKPDPEYALAVVCFRLSSPTRLVDCVDAFGRSQAGISPVCNAVTTFLDNRFSKLLPWHPQLNNYDKLLAFGQAILNDGGQGDWDDLGFYRWDFYRLLPEYRR